MDDNKPNTVSTDEAAAPAKAKAAPKQRFLVSGNYQHPYFAGIAMPTGTALQGIVSATLEEKKPGQGITEKQALEVLQEAAGKEVMFLAVASISALPKNW